MINWPGVCKKYGWDPDQLCGPVIMGLGQNPEGNCCWGHSKGCKAHQRPQVSGSAFDPKLAGPALMKAGLSGRKEELVAMLKAGKGRPASPRR